MLHVGEPVGVKIDARLEFAGAEKLGQKRVAFAHDDFVFADGLKILVGLLRTPGFQPSHDRFIRVLVQRKVSLPLRIQEVFVLLRRITRRHQPGIVSDHRHVVVPRIPVALPVFVSVGIEGSLGRIVPAHQAGFDQSGHVFVARPDDVRDKFSRPRFGQYAVGDPFTRCPIGIELYRIALFEVGPELLNIVFTDVAV